jgi:hypothetical protein
MTVEQNIQPTAISTLMVTWGLWGDVSALVPLHLLFARSKLSTRFLPFDLAVYII